MGIFVFMPPKISEGTNKQSALSVFPKIRKSPPLLARDFLGTEIEGLFCRLISLLIF